MIKRRFLMPEFMRGKLGPGMVPRRRMPILIALASMAMAAAAAIPSTAANAASPAPSPTATTPTASAPGGPPPPPQPAPGTTAGPVRSLPVPAPTALPAGVSALGVVPPGQAPASSAAHPGAQQASVSPDATQEGPYNIQPYTDIYDAADAYHQNDATYAWLYEWNDSAAQRWYEAGAYNIDGYVGSAIYAYYGGHDMCMNVKGNNYTKGTQIWVSECEKSLQLNELWEIFAWNVDGVTMYTLCASYNTGLCINVKGGIASGNLLIVWDLDQLWDNSLWQFYTA